MPLNRNPDHCRPSPRQSGVFVFYSGVIFTEWPFGVGFKVSTPHVVSDCVALTKPRHYPTLTTFSLWRTYVPCFLEGLQARGNTCIKAQATKREAGIETPAAKCVIRREADSKDCSIITERSRLWDVESDPQPTHCPQCFRRHRLPVLSHPCSPPGEIDSDRPRLPRSWSKPEHGNERLSHP
jgi:hypothetical protein